MDRKIIAVATATISSFLCLAAGSGTALAQCPSQVGGADVIVGDMNGWLRYGTVGTAPNAITGYIFGTTSCNIGDKNLKWLGNSVDHPVIGMNAYRLKNGRFEQIGMSWVKHGWAADAANVCCTCQPPGTFYALGVGCSDTYDANTNGIQGGFTDSGEGNAVVSGLGQRSEINAFTGQFFWPYSTRGMTGNATYKRLDINNNDIDPTMNAGAVYFADGQYVSQSVHTTDPDPNVVNEPASHALNNVSYKKVNVSGTAPTFTLSFGTNPIHQMVPGIQAWQDTDPSVIIQIADVPSEGRFYLGTKITNNGNGTWHYEYALYNMNSDRSGHDFTVPSPAGVVISNVGFHAPFYHSGEIYNGADWSQIPIPGGVQWATTAFATNANANALRWGTLYNFRFDATTPPHGVNATLGLFKPGSPTSITIPTKGPSRLGDTNGDDMVNIDDLVNVITGWGRCPAPPAACPGDTDGNGVVNIDDLVRVITNWG